MLQRDETLRARRMQAMRAYRKNHMTADDLEARVDAIRREMTDRAELREQMEYLNSPAAGWQERAEDAFLYGMIVGGIVVMVVLPLTLWLVGAFK